MDKISGDYNSKIDLFILTIQHPCVVEKSFDAKPPRTDKRCSQSGIHRVQYIGAGGRHPFWHGRRAGRPRQQPGQASGGARPKSHVRWFG
ncbi:hypothetical protein TNCV_2924781 [Trichonephila clavipes]|nr:hypothetical protein TNCV_2924781 [Trichonephila clavipes]